LLATAETSDDAGAPLHLRKMQDEKNVEDF
jgi:hypothetical protein